MDLICDSKKIIDSFLYSGVSHKSFSKLNGIERNTAFDPITFGLIETRK